MLMILVSYYSQSNTSRKRQEMYWSVCCNLMDILVFEHICYCGRYLCRLTYLFIKELYKKEARVSQFIAYPANQALALPID
jgi:hypothetical protein